MNTASALAFQTWTFYAVVVSFISARLIFRRIVLKSFSDLQADDWIMVFLLLPFTASMVLALPVATSEPIRQLTYRYVHEELQMVITWLVKACILVLHWRIFPVASSILHRRYIQIVSATCALSFIITQISLLSWCQPTRTEDDSQCSTYHNHTIISLMFSTLTTVLVLILPTPFIPTPRRFLLIILMIAGISTLVFGIIARYSILTAPEQRPYLFYYNLETTFVILFANLPFLTSLVVSTTPARIREFGRNLSFSRENVHLPLSPWPRSRRMSVQDIRSPPLRTTGFGSTATVTSGGTERKEWSASAPVTRPGSVKYEIETLRRPDSGRGWPLP